MKKNYIIFLLLYFSLLACDSPNLKSLSQINNCSKSPGTDIPANYTKLKQQILNIRDSLHSSYILADSQSAISIINFSRSYIFETITNDIFNYWYGTPWDFNGQTRIPGQGTIACGYFVTGVLSDAGFNVPRVAWAQLASEVFIRKLTTDVKVFSNKPIEEVKAYVEKRPDGLYIVGLDTHVGFIYMKNDTIKFVHSNYYQPSIGVMAQDFETDNPLNDSKYRVLGRLFDEQMIRNWINNKAYK